MLKLLNVHHRILNNNLTEYHVDNTKIVILSKSYSIVIIIRVPFEPGMLGKLFLIDKIVVMECVPQCCVSYTITMRNYILLLWIYRFPSKEELNKCCISCVRLIIPTFILLPFCGII